MSLRGLLLELDRVLERVWLGLVVEALIRAAKFFGMIQGALFETSRKRHMLTVSGHEAQHYGVGRPRK